MTVTAQQVIDSLNAIFSDTGDGKWTPAQKLEFVNMAIDAAWDFGIKDTARDSSITLANQTYVYTPTSTPEIEEGYSKAYVAQLNTLTGPPVRLHSSVHQLLAGSTWTIVVANKITSTFNGKTLYLDYNKRIARVTTATDSIALPRNYLWKYVAFIAVTSVQGKSANFDAKPWEPQIPLWLREAEAAASSARRGYITRMPITYETASRQYVNPDTGVYRSQGGH